MTARRQIIYYECIDRPMDASYETLLESKLVKNKDVLVLTVDSCSDALQFDLIAKGLDPGIPCLLIVDSSVGQQTTGLVSLLNQVKSIRGSLFWCGVHDFSKKALAMLNGQEVPREKLNKSVLAWINEY